MRCILFYGILLLSSSLSSQGSFMRIWPYENLAAAADVIAVVAVTGIEDSDMRMMPPTDPSTNRGHVATMQVGWVIKGSDDLRQLRFLYFTKYSEGFSGEGGPPEAPDFKIGPTRQYLVFLKKREDGLYVPVSGEREAVSSVKEIVANGISPIIEK